MWKVDILTFCFLLDLLIGTAGVGPQGATSAHVRGAVLRGATLFCSADNLSGLGIEVHLHPPTARYGLA